MFACDVLFRVCLCVDLRCFAFLDHALGATCFTLLVFVWVDLRCIVLLPVASPYFVFLCLDLAVFRSALLRLALFCFAVHCFS